MLKFIIFPAILFSVSSGFKFTSLDKRGASLKPISACCDIPELGNLEHLAACSNPRPPGPCDDVKCVFEKAGFLTDGSLNREAYSTHLRTWLQSHQNWTAAVDRAITECVNRDLRQYLAQPCKAYDVFVCTSIAFMKKCPDEAWKC